ncbi:MAG: hypothetical protein AB1728_12480, partial [Bacteroidota bacterium]
ETTLSNISANDNLKITIPPPSALEFLYFLRQKGHIIYSAPTIVKDDFKDMRSFMAKYKKNFHALSLTKNLLDPITKEVPQLKKLKALFKNKKITSASELFDYSNFDSKKFSRIVAPKFNAQGAFDFIKSKRKQYKLKIAQQGPEDLSHYGVDDFNVAVDISNICNTIYQNAVASKDTIFSFLLHGMYPLLSVHPQNGFWKDRFSIAPAVHSIAGLLLSISLRSFKTYSEASEFFNGCIFAIKNYMREFQILLSNNLELREYISTPFNHINMSNTKIVKHDSLIEAEQYLTKYCHYCYPTNQAFPLQSPIDIGPTGLRYKFDEKDVVDFAQDEEGRKKHAEDILESTRQTFKDLNIFNPEHVDEGFQPPDQTTSKLLLALSGYSFKDWK